MKQISRIVIFILAIHATDIMPTANIATKLDQLKTWYTQDPQKQKIIKAAGAVVGTCIVVLAGGSIICLVNKHCKKTNNAADQLDQSADQNLTSQNSTTSTILLEEQQTLNDNFLRAIKSDNAAGAFDWLQKGASVNSCDTNLNTALHHAIIIGNPDAINFLIANKASINARTKSGATPLFLATLHGKVSIMETLISRGADINQGDAWGQTPLIMAAEGNDTNSMQILIDNKALINAQDDHGKTALLVATRSSSPEAVTLLLKNGADVNLATKDNKITPLMAAVTDGDKNMVTLLLDAGADATLKDSKGKTALDCTSQKTEPLTFGYVSGFNALQGAYKEIVQIFQDKRPELFTHIPEDDEA